MTRLFVILLWLVGTAWAAVPNRNLTFVAVPADDADWARETARRVGRHAEQRLGLNPDKVHVLERAPSPDRFMELFRSGPPFRYVSHDDLVVVYLAGARVERGGIRLAGGHLAPARLADIADTLRKGPGDDLGFFDGTVLVVLDRAPGPPLDLPEKRGVALLELESADAPAALDASLPDDAEPVVEAGYGALRATHEGPAPKVSRAALAWAGVLEQTLADPGAGTDAAALHARLAKARPATGVSARHRPAPGVEAARFRLLLPRLRVALFPRLLRNAETLALLDHLAEAIRRSAPPSLAPSLVVERTEQADPTADIRCQAVATDRTAHVECVEARAPIFSDRVDVTRPEVALQPLVRQILRDYAGLAATDWSKRRRDLKPLDIVLLVDVSLSMAYHDPTTATDPEHGDATSKRELMLVRLAAALGAHAERTGRPARLTTLLFGDTVRTLDAPGAKEGTLTLAARSDDRTLAALAAVFRDAARPQPYTGIAAALTAATRRLASAPADHARHVVLLTDGRETVERADPEGTVRRAARAVQAVGATLSCVGLSEEGGRLPGYLERMRAGGDVLRRYVRLLDMKFAAPACRRDDGWTPDQARTCGAFYAGHIERGGAYDAALLDEVRRSDRAGVPTGLFLQPDSGVAFQQGLQELLVSLTGGGIYAMREGQRETADDGAIRDRWQLQLDLDGPARVVLYNSDGLRELRWTVRRDGRELGRADGVRFEDEGDAVNVVVLPAPARGTWEIERVGVRP